VRAKLLLGDIAKQIETEYATPVDAGQSDVTLQQLTSEFRKFNADNNSAGWASIQQLYMRRILEFLGPDTLLKDITAKRIEEYASWRRIDVKGTTVNKELSTIRMMFDKAVDWNFVPSNRARR
jgi:hypothetical protein